MSKLLINEPPLLVSPTLATLIGLNQAIVLQQVHYWLENAKTGKNPAKYKQGRYWVYNSYGEWQEGNFPFWDPKTIERVFNKLEESKLVISAQFGGYDRRKWYTIDYTKLAQLELNLDTKSPLVQIALMDDSHEDKTPQSKGTKRPNRKGQDVPLLNESEINQENNEQEIDPLIQKIISVLPPDMTKIISRLEPATVKAHNNGKNGTIQIIVPTAEDRDWLEQRGRRYVEQALVGLLRDEELEFVVEGKNG